MLQLDDTIFPLPAPDRIPDPPPPLGDYGFGLMDAPAMDSGMFLLTMLVAVAIAVIIVGTIVTTSNAAADNKRSWRVVAGLLAGMAVTTGCTILLVSLLAPFQSPPDQSAAFISWASHTYDVEVSRAGYVALTSGESVAVPVSGVRAEVHLGAAQDGLVYLFDSRGIELMPTGGLR